MAFGGSPFGVMMGQSASGPLAGQRFRDPRFAYANALIQSGSDTSPVQSPWQGVARVGSGLAGGWLAHDAKQEWDKRETDYAKAMAEALKAGSGTPAVTQTSEDQSAYGGPGPVTTTITPAVAADPQKMLAILGGNRDTAPMATQFQLQSLAAQQAQAAQANQPYTLTPGAVRFGAGGQQIAAAPATPERPQTVNTAEGVFTLNRDGTLGTRLGGPSSLVTMNLPPSGYQPAPQGGGMTHIPGGPADPAVIEAKARAEQSAKPDAAAQKALTDYKSAVDEATVIVNSLQDFRNASKSAGVGETAESLLGRTTPLNTAYNKAALMAKGEQLFALGVLNGPDLDIIRRTLPDPATLSGATTRQPAVDAAVQQVIDLIQDRVNTKARTANQQPTNLIEYGQSIRGQDKPAGNRKVLQTRTINGVTYEQDENGDWFQK